MILWYGQFVPEQISLHFALYKTPGRVTVEELHKDLQNADSKLRRDTNQLQTDAQYLKEMERGCKDTGSLSLGLFAPELGGSGPVVCPCRGWAIKLCPLVCVFCKCAVIGLDFILGLFSFEFQTLLVPVWPWIPLSVWLCTLFWEKTLICFTGVSANFVPKRNLETV